MSFQKPDNIDDTTWSHFMNMDTGSSSSSSKHQFKAPGFNCESNNHSQLLPRLLFDHHDIVENCINGSEQLVLTEKVPASCLRKKGVEPQIKVINADTVDVGRAMLQEGLKNPLLLNMANKHGPGGGQEGCLMKQLALAIPLEDYASLMSRYDKTLYPIPEQGAIYTPWVADLRGSEWDDYAVNLIQDEPVDVFDVLSIAAVNYHSWTSDRNNKMIANACVVGTKLLKIHMFDPMIKDIDAFLSNMSPKYHARMRYIYNLVKTDEKKFMEILSNPPKESNDKAPTWSKLSSALFESGNKAVFEGCQEAVFIPYYKLVDSDDDVISEMCNRVRYIFRAAAIKGHRNLVLGAFGCGIFGNDAETIANIFKIVMSEKEFNGLFDHIRFAVTEGMSRPYSENQDIFSQVLLGTPPSKPSSSQKKN